MIINNKTFIVLKNTFTSKHGVIILILLTLFACSSSNYKILVMDYFDSNDKTVTMTHEIDLLTLGLKESFLNNEWFLTTYNITDITDPISFTDINTRYIMFTEYTLGNDLFYGNFIREYKITIYDITNNLEMVILYGDGRTLESLLKEFETVIESNYSN